MNTLSNTKTKALGFSLIELMVVIAIVALLAAVAIPSYKSYIGQSRMGEVMNFVSQAQKTWVENAALGTTGTTITAPTSTIASIVFSGTGFVVTMTVSNKIADEFNGTAVVATYTASADTSGAYSWTCVVTGAANTTQRTTITSNYFTNCTNS